MVTITHAKVVSTPDDGTSDVGSDEWNAAHVVTGVRDKLTADRTYYVRTDGSDSNDGLTNTAGGAFATSQHAYDVIASTLDLGGHNVTIQMADGSYDSTNGVINTAIGAWSGAGNIIWQGNTGNQTAVSIDIGNSSSGILVHSSISPGAFDIQYMKVAGTGGSAFLLVAFGQVIVNVTNVDFGHCAIGISANFNATVNVSGDYTISSQNTSSHIAAFYSSNIQYFPTSITLTAGVVSYDVFAEVALNSVIETTTFTINGSPIHGLAFQASSNGVLYIDDGNVNVFPQATGVGVTSVGGQVWLGAAGPWTTTVAGLVGAPYLGAGERQTVTDSTVTLAAGIGNVVVGGGANTVPVFYDGTNWRIG